MAIVFPASPSVNDTFTEGSITYKWDGAKWIGLGVTPADRLVEGSNKLEIDASNQLTWTGGSALLVGTTSGADGGSNQSLLFVEGNTSGASSYGGLMLRRGETGIAPGTSLGRIFFGDQSGEAGARISGLGDGAWGVDDHPGKIEFDTVEDGSNAWVNRMTIKANGNIGMGQSDPTSLLVIGAENAISTVKPTVVISDTTNGASIVLRGQSPKIVFDRTSSGNAKIYTDDSSLTIYSGNLDSDGTTMAEFTSSGNFVAGGGVFSNEFFSNTQTNDDSTSNIAFRPRNAAGGSPAASLRVGVSGQCYIPAGGVTYAMRVGHDTGTTYASGEHGYIAFAGAADDFVFLAARNVADGTPVITNDVGGTRQFEIEADGDMYNINGTYGQTSDARLKENIVDAGSQWDDIKALIVRNFNFREDLGYNPKTQIGFVAQEVEEVSPGLVKTNPDKDLEGNDLGTETKVLRMSVLHVKAVKALQEAMVRIEELEARLEAGGL